jgi:peptidoglycan/LPS O-acetylase OafA/YrhL
MKSRLSELDAMRGIAAIMVVLYHYSTWHIQSEGYSSTVPLFTFSAGIYGVHLFFMISGFVIFLTLNRVKHIMDFVIARFARLYPAYWVAVPLIFILSSYFSLPGREVSIDSFLFNFTMLQGWFGIRHVDGVFWILSVELVFYVMMALLYYFKKLSNINSYSLLLLFIILLSHYLESEQLITINKYIKLFMMLEYGSLFIMGIMFYKILNEKGYAPYFIVFIAFLVDIFIRQEAAVLISIYFVTFILFTSGALTFLRIKVFTFLGSISYSLYLVHQNIGYIVIHGLENYGLANSISVLLVPSFITIGLATLMSIFIEKPTLSFIRNSWKFSKLRKKIKVIK